MAHFLRFAPAHWRGLVGLAWLVSFGWLTGCSKDRAAPAPGSIEGTLLPAGGATGATATAADGRTYQTVPDPATGQVRFTALPAGAYTLTFATVLAYHTPLPVAVQVGAGATARPAFPTLTHDATVRGTMRWTLGNDIYTATRVGGEVNGTLVSLVGLAAQAGASHEVVVVIPVEFRGQTIFRGVGTYELGRQEYPFGEYTYYPGGTTNNFSKYRTSYPGATPTGTVTVTRFDPKAFAIAGTFAFVAEANSNATGTVQIAQGQFDLTY